MEGNTGNRTMPILINLGVSNNYVAPSVVLNCSLNKSNLKVPSLVQLATKRTIQNNIKRKEKSQK